MEKIEFGGEEVISIDCAGTFYTMNGKFKVLTIVVKIKETETAQ
jgi:hypothetical protein